VAGHLGHLCLPGTRIRFRDEGLETSSLIALGASVLVSMSVLSGWKLKLQAVNGSSRTSNFGEGNDVPLMASIFICGSGSWNGMSSSKGGNKLSAESSSGVDSSGVESKSRKGEELSGGESSLESSESSGNEEIQSKLSSSKGSC